mgnify:CR=1 FL=1
MLIDLDIVRSAVHRAGRRVRVVCKLIRAGGLRGKVGGGEFQE